MSQERGLAFVLFFQGGCSDAAFKFDQIGPARQVLRRKLRSDREQTAHLQTALLHLPVRTQIRTAQLGSIRSQGLGAIALPWG